MFIILTCIGIIALLFHNFYWKRRSFPPGPTPLPLLGNVLTLKKYAPGYEAYKKWAREYGPIYTIWMGPQPMIIIADYEVMKKTIIKDGAKYAGRAPNPHRLMTRGGEYGVIESSGDIWNQHRRFAIQVLRDFGFGKNLMEERILSEVTSFIKTMNSECQKGPIDLQDHIDAATGSIINNLLFGYRYDESNMEEFLHLKNQLTEQLAAFGEPAVVVLMMWPWLGKYPIFKKYHTLIMSTAAELFAMYRRQIEAHRKEIDFDAEQSTDYCEAYLKEQKKHEHEPDFGGFSDIQLVNMCFDLWVAGMETTSNTLYWGLLYIIRDPSIMKRAHSELDTVIGEQRYILGSDKPNLHFINAVVQESQRMANLLPFSIPRRNLEDVEIEGFKIPKDTIIVPQISAVLLDDKVFPDPYRFDPNRHLDSNGYFIKIEEMIPFSVGKRACIGESMAKSELFLFFANIFHFFDVTALDMSNLPSTEKRIGATMKAINYEVNLIPRNNNYAM